MRITYIIDLNIGMPAADDLAPQSSRLRLAEEDDFVAIHACFKCKRVDVKLIDFGGFQACRGCMQLTTRVTETALANYSSEGSVRSSRSSASSRENSRDEENSSDFECFSHDSDESEAAKALTSLTYLPAGEKETEENSTDDPDEGSEKGHDAWDSSDEEDADAGDSPPQPSRVNIELQRLVDTVVRERPESFEAVTAFQLATTYTIYKPLGKSQYENGILDFGRCKLFTCPLVIKP